MTGPDVALWALRVCGAVVAVVVALALASPRRPRVRAWRQVAVAPDPGNPGQQVRLMERTGAPGRWVLVRNGTAPHLRHWIPVRADAPDPITAVAETYGLTAAQYRTCEKRT